MLSDYPFPGSGSLSRRQLLAFGLGAFVLPRAAAAGAPRRPARGVILVLLEGGMSQLETWDPKPDAPREVRCEFGTIATSLPGLRVGEHMPRLARELHRGNLLRAVHCDARNDHSPGLHLLLTGYENVAAGVAMETANYRQPAMGAVLAHRLGVTTADGMPRFVALPRRGQLGGAVKYTGPLFLGPACEAFEVGAAPAAARQPMSLPPALLLPRDVTRTRLGNRLGLRTSLDRLRAALDRDPRVGRVDAHYQRALQLLTGRRLRDALDLSREPAALRAIYGDHAVGQGLLLARRLVEAGATYVLVNTSRDNDWDTHSKNFTRLKDGLLPPLDRGVAALLRDLDQRGLLDEVLVLVAGEMGRTPVVNANAGRDHWTSAYSVFLAGGGLTRGQVLGSTTPDGRSPGSRPVTVPEILATVYHRLGIDPNTLLTDAQGRPLPILPGARPLAELLA